MAQHEIFSATTQFEFLSITERHGYKYYFLPTPENLSPEGKPTMSIEEEDASGNVVGVFLLTDNGDDGQVSQLLLADAFAALFQPPATH